MAVETRAAIDLGASLAQALRYVNAWKSKTVVVKYGGSVMTSRVGRADGDTVIARRIEAARAEMARQPEFQYVIVNAQDRLDAAVDQIEHIVDAERARRA